MAIFTPPLTQGSSFPDGLRVGKIDWNVIEGETSAAYDQGAPGVSMGLIYPYIIMPVAASSTNLANGITGAYLVANQGNVPLTAGAGVTVDTTTYINPSGNPYTAYSLDVARTLVLTTTNNVTAIQFTVSGWDMYGAKVVEQGTSDAESTTIVLNKAFKAIHSIVANGATADAGISVSVGTSNLFGLPYVVNNASNVFIEWNGVMDYLWSSGDGVLQPAGGLSTASTIPSTAVTGDVRGTYIPNNAVAPNGTKVLTLIISLPAADPIYTRGSTVSPVVVYGVPQYNTGWQ